MFFHYFIVFWVQDIIEDASIAWEFIMVKVVVRIPKEMFLSYFT